jgi:hypothetical protein
VTISWTGVGWLEEAPAASGPWYQSARQANPQTQVATDELKFYRVRQ